MTVDGMVIVDVSEGLNFGMIFLVSVPLRVYAADKLAFYVCILCPFLSVGNQT